jgi:hypothetical protein
MDRTNLEKDSDVERLRANYRGAFDQWALQVNEMQKVREATPCSPAMQEAEDRVEAAQTVYRDTRDRLAEDLLERSAASA